MASMYKAERDAINHACHSDYENNRALDSVRKYLPEKISQVTSTQLNNNQRPNGSEKNGVKAYLIWFTNCSNERADMNRKEGVSDRANTIWLALIEDNKRLLNKLSAGQMTYGQYLSNAKKLSEDTKEKLSPATDQNPYSGQTVTLLVCGLTVDCNNTSDALRKMYGAYSTLQGSPGNLSRGFAKVCFDAYKRVSNFPPHLINNRGAIEPQIDACNAGLEAMMRGN